MASTAIRTTMTLSEFHASRQWKSLTEGQKRWVSGVIEHGDAKRATAEAYKSDDEAYIAMFTRKIESSPNVTAALDAFYQRSERDKFIRDLRLNIQNSEGIAKIEAQKLLARILGLDAPAIDCTTSAKPIKTKPPFEVGDRVIQNSKTYIVRAVSADGWPTDAVEEN
jgi:hypothetical protein